MRTNVRFGYVPYDETLTRPGDRRRFCYWARERGVPFEVARPGGRYDVVVLSAAADLSVWTGSPTSGPKLVYDLIDSYLDLPRRSAGNVLRGAAKFAARQTRGLLLDYRGAMEAMCRRADAVVCSTEEQRTTLLPLADNVHPILDAHFDLATTHKESYEAGATLNLVWEGLPYTLDDFAVAAPALRALAARRSLALHLVTDLRFAQYARRFRRRETIDLARRILPEAYLYAWNPHLLADIVTACDLAVVPLDLADPLARGKPENKLLLFWRLGLPAVVSATPAYRRVMAEAGLDLTCSTVDDWERTIDALADDEGARAEAGRRGRAYVETRHSREALLDRWDAVFASILA